MSFLFNSRQLWRRQIERATSPGSSTNLPMLIVLAASTLHRRPKEMKKLLTGARKNHNPISPNQLSYAARRYRHSAAIIAEIARCLRDQKLGHSALATLREHHASCNSPTPLLKTWYELIHTSNRPSQSDCKAFQQALERGISSAGSDKEKLQPLCQFWIDHHRILPNPSTVENQIAVYLQASIPDSLTNHERTLLTHTLSRPGIPPAPAGNGPTTDLSSLPTATPLLLVCARRSALTSFQAATAFLESTGRSSRSFCLDCLDRRDIYWSDHGGTRTHKEPAFTFLGDQRLSSLRLLARLLESNPLVITPEGDPATEFLGSLPESLRPKMTSIAVPAAPEQSQP